MIDTVEIFTLEGDSNQYFQGRTGEDGVGFRSFDYLAAFADAAELTLVTFDRRLAAKVAGTVLLG